MAGAIGTNVIKDGNGTAIVGGVRMFDVSGTGVGPWVPVSYLYDPVSGQLGTIKPASTPPVAADTAMVVAIHPSSVNPNGQATSANSAPVVISSNQIFSGQNQTSPNNQFLVGGQFNTSPTTITAGNASPLQLDNAGNLKANINVALPAGSNTIGGVTAVAATSGGLTATSIVTTAAAIVGNVKASAGQLYKVELSNNSASWVYLKLYDTAGSPTAGVGTPQRRIGVPPSSTLLTTTDIGGVYSTGIGYAIVGGAPDADSSAVAANILVNFLWK